MRAPHQPKKTLHCLIFGSWWWSLAIKVFLGIIEHNFLITHLRRNLLAYKNQLQNGAKNLKLWFFLL